MMSVAIRVVMIGVAFATITNPLQAADAPSPASKPAAAIIVTNKTESAGRLPYLSAGLPEIVKMHKAGVDASVLMAFVQNSPVAYHPSAKEIIYLRDQGIASEIIAALLRRGGELRDRAAEAAREERNRAVPAPTAPATPPIQPSAPAPQAAAPTVVYVNPTYPVYTMPTYTTYPAYNYSYSYVWPAYYNYSYRPYYYRAGCYPYAYGGYRSPWYPSYYAGYRSGCYSGWGTGAGYRGGYYGHSGGYRYAGGWRGGAYCRR